MENSSSRHEEGVRRRPAVLETTDLSVVFRTDDGDVSAVDGVSFALQDGECLGVVGESGSGKSQLFLASMGLQADNGCVTGSVKLDSTELIGLDRSALRKVRGRLMGMIFQDPMTALTPHLTVGRQLAEVLTEHGMANRRTAKRKALEALEQVQLPAPRERLNQYPHELSGGMRQRVMIAMALIGSPKVLIADEPTTALDVTVQADILDLLRELKLHQATSIIMITHDLGVVAGLCDRVVVMYAGTVVEQGATSRIINSPLHPYTRGLLASIPRMDHAASAPLTMIPGHPPDPHDSLPGCPFEPRCAYRIERCVQEKPQLRTVADGHFKACHLDAIEDGP